MKRILLLAILIGACTLARAADSKPKLDDNLAGLEKLLGTWQVTAPDDNGKQTTITYTLVSGADGKAVVLTGKGSDGSVINALWYFDPATKSVAHHGVASTGEVWKRIYPMRIDGTEYMNYFFLTRPDGSQVSATENVKWIDKDTWTLTPANYYSGGKKESVEAMTFKRVK
jgi:hypothetical protein